MSTDRDTTRVVRSWLRTDEHESADRVLGAVLDRLDATPQRRAKWWPVRRNPPVNRFLTFGLAAAAVVVVLFIGSQLLGSPGGNVGGPGDEPTQTPAASVADPTVAPTPSASATWTGIPEGTTVVTNTDGAPVQVTVDITSPGWVALGGLDGVTKNDDGRDAPQTVGGAFLAWGWPAGTGFNVYGDPCQWSTTVPETPATTPDDIAAAFATQAQTDATEAVDVTIGGYAGKQITLHVPMTYEIADATREEEFAACDESSFTYYGAGEEAITRNAQGPGEVDELWIVDVDGSIVILNAVYSPAASAELIDELRALAESATFEAP
jgi:hypothetical protein